jgi:hypothetical protein
VTNVQVFPLKKKFGKILADAFAKSEDYDHANERWVNDNLRKRI